ncbi:MAG: enolase C-terminal domain-like protein [Pseudorhodoplanes sp.]|uniref:enolase C-terminal domain-like protein n=1 Tax=Pseudorhodoplanes sp. TaxID=1934341 RepID=UPI003D101F79
MQARPLTFRGITARAVVLKLKRPIVARIMTIAEWPLILIDLDTDEGVTGRSYIGPYNVASIKYLLPIIRDFGHLFSGQPMAPSDLYAKARKSLHLVGYSGMSMVAVSALDMAAWDAAAKAAGMPLCVLLGGSVGPVRAYNSNGLWLAEPEKVAAEAPELRDAGGFRGLKLRLGRAHPRDDLAAIEAIRKSVGEDIALMADFNQGLDMAEALARCPSLDDLGLAWIEEPILYENIAGCAKLAGQLKTPIQIGENFYGPRDLADALDAKACDFVMPDLMRIGGVTGWLRAAAIAGTAGIPVSTHLYPEFSAHVMRVTETAHWLEWQDWAEAVLQRPFPVKDGMVSIPDLPGAGIEWDEDAVKRHAIEM